MVQVGCGYPSVPEGGITRSDFSIVLSCSLKKHHEVGGGREKRPCLMQTSRRVDMTLQRFGKMLNEEHFGLNVERERNTNQTLSLCPHHVFQCVICYRRHGSDVETVFQKPLKKPWPRSKGIKPYCTVVWLWIL
ncbi:hypothetical protein F2P81_003131 [Scophthalmus maximus]|uniref:Uncharacterized protein n=1 Tax=Scophthalmus maximus TaxID=52904 RepID=A0A6A4RRI1_SCOMX|nr:hypothetical protein F2P81_026115 [Scophthalmus maximus]KAF0043973.1 hypothetical protein F2P81_003131 [Scophthalmus maximus]